MQGAIGADQHSLTFSRAIWPYIWTWWFLPFAFFLYRISISIYRLTLHPLAIYPGPITWQISRVPWHIALRKGNLHQRLLAFHERYGPIVRIAPNELSYAHADAWRDIYGNKNFERNKIWFKRPPGQPDSIMGSDEANHSRMRRAFSGAFSEAGINEMSSTVNTYVNRMVTSLRGLIERAGGEDVVNLVAWLEFTTFDISSDLSFGEGFGSIEKAKAHPWVEISSQFGKAIAIMASIQFLWPLNRILAMMMPKTLTLAFNFDPDATPTNVREKFIFHQGLTRHKVGRRLSAASERADFIGSALKYNAEMTAKDSNDKIITRGELNENMAIIVFAGSETTSSALSGIFRYLLKDEQAYNRLVKEIRNTFKRSEDISIASVAPLEYLTAVLNEGLRLAPPPVIGVPREAVKDDVVCGQPVPAGTLVAINQFAANRATFNFARAEEFLPTRFLPEGKLPVDNMDMFQPFFVGRHLCIGYKLAWVMMRLIMAKLIFEFDFELLDKSSIPDFGQQKTYIFWEKEPLKIRLKRRKSIEAE